MNETLFYVLGLGLVVAALVVSALGIRSERFPSSRGLLMAITAVFAVLVVSTSVFGWLNAEDEQEHREHELAEAESENLEEGNVGEAAEAGATTTTTETAEAADGEQVFVDNQCGGCHTLQAAGATGTTGPVLDSSLQGKSPDYIRTGIVDPNDELAEDFPGGVMPQNYEDVLTPEELDALVEYISLSVAGKS